MTDTQLRRVLRSLFTKEFNTFVECLRTETEIIKAEVTAKFGILKTRYEKLSECDEQVMTELMKKPDLVDEELTAEFEKTADYETKFLTARSLFDDYLSKLTDNKSLRSLHGDEACSQEFSTYMKHKFRPEITKKFDGSIGSWIGFWTQFAKIHESTNWTDDEKFDILLTGLKPNSPAQKLIDRFPPSKENYAKAVNLLKSRFGKDEYLIEYYVRQLLSLVLTKSPKKTISELYDELEVQLSALDTLKVTKEKYAAMLFPLVESAVPEDVFKIWERHRVGKEASMVDPADCLTALLEFLRIEVAGEERLKLRTGDLSFRPEDSSIIEGSGTRIPTATSLTAGTNYDERKRESVCIFCDNSHASQDCVKAIDLSLTQRQDVVKKKGGCFKCLRKTGHLSASCNYFVKCAVCRGKHFVLMCQKLEPKTDMKKSAVSETAEALLTSGVQKNYITYLQTLIATIKFGDREQKVRVLLDSGSQRSYIVKSCVREMKLDRLNKVLVQQEVFGGNKTSLRSHGVYNITLKCLNDSFECEFEVLDQERICSFVPKLNNAAFHDTLKTKGIVLTDFSENVDSSADVQILLGADSWAKIVMNEHVQLKSGLLAINTKLGWTLLGSSDDESTIASSLLVTLTCHAHLANLWDLELLGVRDPAVQVTQDEKDRQVQQFFEKTVKFEEGRYTVNLPSIEGHAPLEDNKECATRRLISITQRLKESNNFEAYNEVFQGWIKEGIVEFVSGDNISNCNFLPHRPLTYLSEDPDELTPLRPSMFLQTLSGNGVEDLDQIDHVSMEKRWNYLQEVRSGLKARFHKEYLGILRSSRPRRTDTVKIGDVVLIGSDNKRRIEWPLARVIDLIPGRDGITRVAKIKTQQGEFLRPLQRLYALEIQDGILNTPPDANDVQTSADQACEESEPELEDFDGFEERQQPIQTRSGRSVKPREILDL